MRIDVHGVTSFLAAHGRLLDRRRLQLLLQEQDAELVLTALEAYRNPDGGYGWGLEPDLRSNVSQPVAAMHALEVLAEVAPVVTSPRAVELCDWLHRHTLPDGGLPLALPVADAAGCAPFWARADPGTSSLQMTAQVAANAQLVGRHQGNVAVHPWLSAATEYCLDAVSRIDEPHAYELMFALRFLDAVADLRPEALELLERLGRSLPATGSVHVEGGTADETLHPLNFAPYPGRPSRALFSDNVIAADLERLATQQQPDGGWLVDFPSYSPAAALEWRGYTTVHAVQVLRSNS